MLSIPPSTTPQITHAHLKKASGHTMNELQDKNLWGHLEGKVVVSKKVSTQVLKFILLDVTAAEVNKEQV